MLQKRMNILKEQMKVGEEYNRLMIMGQSWLKALG